MSHFEWTEFYREFADKLVEYRKDREKLVSMVKEIYIQTGIHMPTLDHDNNLEDIDPFTVFGLFNKSSMKNSKRIAIIENIKKQFNINAKVPKTFDSVPVLNNQNATYYLFKNERQSGDIDGLWDFYESVLAYSKKQSDENKKDVCKYFDKIIQYKGIGNSKATMGMYWIAPDIYLNLDNRNQWYIYDSGKIPQNVVEELPELENKISGKVYFTLIDRLKAYLSKNTEGISNFKELSFAAWEYSTQVNDEIKGKSRKSNALSDEETDTVHYWIFAPGEQAVQMEKYYKNGIMSIGWSELGDLSHYGSKEEIRLKMQEIYGNDKSYKGSAYIAWQFAHELKKGDIVFAKKGTMQLVGKGVVSADYSFHENADDSFQHVVKVNWTHYGEWESPRRLAVKTLTDITSYTEYRKEISRVFGEEGDDEAPQVYTKYTETDFLNDVFISEEEYRNIVGILKRKKNIILQGAPGVGKTFMAKRLAYSLMGEKDTERVGIVQFHQSYSYEDFIMGFRPVENGFELKTGAFYKFCKEAEEDPDQDYYFIIDEINRGNISKIFGELFMLIEADKRGIELQLLYSDEKFSVPQNVYLIGMMNTADRSLAILDYALRRRFAFIEMKPGFKTPGFQAYEEEVNSEKFDRLISCVEDLNEEIAEDESLGEGFMIGHSYFCNVEPDEDIEERLHSIVEFELIPLLKEYWFDETGKVRQWAENLRSAIK